ncbi:hypothetical protein [Bacillus swezeyi]|uniref:hypothetical protein n=1 Tax=Bacillus swezeyi TaxID=1925020 RepID=UPI003F8B224C
MNKAYRAFAYVFGIYNSAMSVVALYNSEWVFAGVYVLFALVFGVLNFISE